MKVVCECALKRIIAKRLSEARRNHQLTQEQFSEKLMIAPRTYAYNEHGDSMCCTLSFIIYLVFCCDDCDKLIEELRVAILNSAP